MILKNSHSHPFQADGAPFHFLGHSVTFPEHCEISQGRMLTGLLHPMQLMVRCLPMQNVVLGMNGLSVQPGYGTLVFAG